jgi:hypothetical protein
MLTNNMRQNLQIVVQVATKYSEQLGPASLIELFGNCEESVISNVLLCIRGTIPIDHRGRSGEAEQAEASNSVPGEQSERRKHRLCCLQRHRQDLH